MKPSSFRYSRLKQEFDAGAQVLYDNPGPVSGLWMARLVTIATIVIAAFGGYLFGRWPVETLDHGLIAPAGSDTREFVYNSVFAMAPTESTSAAWKSLYPENGGFIHHPTLASNFSGIAMFHQLHCLESLYYLYYNATRDSIVRQGHHRHSDAHRAPPPAHATYCFDYLRQALMCHADTNLEQYSYTVDGVTGWGEKRCRSYEAVMDFAGVWG